MSGDPETKSTILVMTCAYQFRSAHVSLHGLLSFWCRQEGHCCAAKRASLSHPRLHPLSPLLPLSSLVFVLCLCLWHDRTHHLFALILGDYVQVVQEFLF